MQIVLHLGAHCTDDDRLVRCLLKNRAILSEEGIAVPPPTRYRKLMRDTAVQLKGGFASAETEAVLLEQIMEEEDAQRLILGWENFIGFPVWVVGDGFYKDAGTQVQSFTRLFPTHPAELHLAIRNPATFLPALQQKVLAKGKTDFLSNTDPMSIRWSDLVQAILYTNPDLPLTVWCDEDTPLIWPEVLQSVAGHRAETALADTDELLSLIISPEGMTRMKAYVAAHPPASVMLRRRVVTAFLEKFAVPEQVVMEFEFPGWTDDLIDRMTQAYYEDIEWIKSMPGVRFILP